jgi:hypothetical protein
LGFNFAYPITLSDIGALANRYRYRYRFIDDHTGTTLKRRGRGESSLLVGYSSVAGTLNAALCSLLRHLLDRSASSPSTSLRHPPRPLCAISSTALRHPLRNGPGPLCAILLDRFASSPRPLAPSRSLCVCSVTASSLVTRKGKETAVLSDFLEHISTLGTGQRVGS